MKRDFVEPALCSCTLKNWEALGNHSCWEPWSMNSPSDKACDWAQGTCMLTFLFFSAHLFIYTEMADVCVYSGSTLTSARVVEELNRGIETLAMWISLGTYQGSTFEHRPIFIYDNSFCSSFGRMKWILVYLLRGRSLLSTLNHYGIITEWFNTKGKDALVGGL